MYMARKCYYMDLLGMSGNINIQSRNNKTSKSDIRTQESQSFSLTGHNSSGTLYVFYNPLREAKVIVLIGPPNL